MIRASRAIPGAVACVLLLLATLAACRVQIQLGDGPDAGDAATEAAPPLDCTSKTDRTLITTADPVLGALRAMAVAAGTLWVLSERDDDHTGVLSKVSADGGTLTEVAELGFDPSALSLSDDGSYAFVALRGSSQIARVDATGTIVIANAGGSPEGVVAADKGRAYWTLPSLDSVVSWDFTSGAPTTVVRSPQATSLLRDGNTLYIVGFNTLDVFHLDVDTSAQFISSNCNEGIPVLIGSMLFCAQGDAIVRVDIGASFSTLITDMQIGASDIVTGNGRVFWRSETVDTSFLSAAPIDGVSGPTIIESGDYGALLITSDPCDVYFTENRAIWRRGF